VQGKLAAHPTIRDVGIATVFKVLGAVSHTQAQAQFGVPEAGAAFDASLKQAETAVRSMVDLKPLSSLTQDVKSHLVIHTKDRDKLMYYDD
jgi:hypothetical protein